MVSSESKPQDNNIGRRDYKDKMETVGLTVTLLRRVLLVLGDLRIQNFMWIHLVETVIIAQLCKGVGSGTGYSELRILLAISLCLLTQSPRVPSENTHEE